MDLNIGDKVFYTHSNGLRPPTTVVGTVEDGLLHLESSPIIASHACRLSLGAVVKSPTQWLELDHLFSCDGGKHVYQG